MLVYAGFFIGVFYLNCESLMLKPQNIQKKKKKNVSGKRVQTNALLMFAVSTTVHKMRTHFSNFTFL